MDLKTWKAAPDGKIQKSDVSVAKNYLNENHTRTQQNCFGLFRFGRK